MIKLVTPPAKTPVSLDEAKDHLRIIGTAEDPYISALLGAATDAVEKMSGRQLQTATFELSVGGFPAGQILLPLPPLQSVEAISYTDPSGVEQSLTTFEVDTANRTVAPAFGEQWPATAAATNAVRVRFIAGYADGEVPFSLRAAILLLVGGLYENREAFNAAKLHDNQAVALLVAPYRVW